jgi:hypothetical protein
MVETAETLKEAVFRRVAECRAGLESGGADMAGLEQSVRAYCEAVAALAKDQGFQHVAPLESLMKEVTALREDLSAAREAICQELTGLSRLKHANVAYQKSDAIGPKRPPKNEEQ